MIFRVIRFSLGAKAAVDRDACLGHISQVVRTPDDFWAQRGGMD